MRKLLKILLADQTAQFYLFVVLAVIPPSIFLVVMGFAQLWSMGWLLWFGLGMLALTAVTLMLRYLLRRLQAKQKISTVENSASHLPAVEDWSTRDTHVWESCRSHIDDANLSETPWADIPDAMLQQIAFVARQYHKDDADAKYAFTVPAMLLMLEVWSREYRKVVLENVPLAQDIKVSTVMSATRQTNSAVDFYKQYGPIVDVARALLSSGASIPGRIASALASELGGALSEHMLRNMKGLLFEQISQVAIDLYSGRLKLSEEELASYRGTFETQKLEHVRPLTAMILGQVNAGKSSLVNALIDECVAESDLLPATERFKRYNLALSDELEIHLLDTPGLDGSSEVAKELLDQATRSDLLIWLSQVNQPAKDLDRQLVIDWDAYFSQELGRKKPPILLLNTHSDQILPDPDSSPNSQQNRVLLDEALDYTQKALGLDSNTPALSVALPPDGEAFNLEAMKTVLTEISKEARHAQLNRERLEAADSAPIVMRGLRQAAGMLSSGARLITK